MQYKTFMSKKQLNLFHTKIYKKGKIAREISTKHHNHVVLKSFKPIIRLHRNKIRKIFIDTQTKFGISVSSLSIMENHIHIVVKVSTRTQFANSMRYLTGTLALKILRSKLWSKRIWSRPIKSKKDFDNVNHYVCINPIKENLWDIFDTYLLINGKLVI